MKQFAVLLLLPFVLIACGKLVSKPEETPGEQTGNQETVVPEPELNAGDVEYALNVAAALAPESRADNIKIDTLVDQLNRPNLLTLTVSPPRPKELWIRFGIRSRLLFMETPVVLRIKFVAELEEGEREVGSYAMVLTDQAFNREVPHKVEVLGALGDLPESVLIRLRCEALLMPKGTDPATLDPETATTAEERTTSAITQCPVRINFVGGEDGS